MCQRHIPVCIIYKSVIVFPYLFLLIVESEHDGVHKGIHLPTVLLRGTAGAPCTVDESADTAHFQYLVLTRVGHIFIYLGHQFGSHSVLNAFQHSE